MVCGYPDDAVDVDAACHDVHGSMPPTRTTSGDLHHRGGRSGGHDRTEVASGLAVDEVARLVGNVRRHEGAVGPQRVPQDAVATVQLPRLVALGQGGPDDILTGADDPAPGVGDGARRTLADRRWLDRTFDQWEFVGPDRVATYQAAPLTAVIVGALAATRRRPLQRDDSTCLWSALIRTDQKAPAHRSTSARSRRAERSWTCSGSGRGSR
jgi:hypothetical protein